MSGVFTGHVCVCVVAGSGFLFLGVVSFSSDIGGFVCEEGNMYIRGRKFHES